MTLLDIEQRVLFQSNNDVDDITDYLPAMVDYINEGYDILYVAFKKAHLEASTDHAPLSALTDTPNLPEWSHTAIGDYATYCIYRNGNPSKQQRGQEYLAAFYRVRQQLEFDISKRNNRHFHGLYVENPKL